MLMLDGLSIFIGVKSSIFAIKSANKVGSLYQIISQIFVAGAHTLGFTARFTDLNVDNGFECSRILQTRTGSLDCFSYWKLRYPVDLILLYEEEVNASFRKFTKEKKFRDD